MDRKKVLILSYHYPPENSSSVFRTLYMANHIVSNSHWRPYILTVNPSKLVNGYLYDETLLSQIDKDIEIYRTSYFDFRTWIVGLKRGNSFQVGSDGKIKLDQYRISEKKCKAKQSLWQKFKDILTDEVFSFPDRNMGWIPYAIKDGLELIKKKKIQLIYSTGGPWSSHVTAHFLKLFSGLPVVLDYRDPWHGNPYNEERSDLFLYLSEKFEKKIINHADFIIFNTYSLKKSYNNKYRECRSKCTIIPNGYEGEISSVKALDRRDIKPINIVHAGGLYGGRNPENFFKAVLDIYHNKCIDIKVQLIGAGDETIDIIKKIVKGADEKELFEVTPRIPHGSVIKYLKNADILLLFQQGTEVQIPRKLYEYMLFRKPILAVCDEGELSRILNECKIGYRIEDDIHQIKTALLEIIDSPPDSRYGNRFKMEQYNNKVLSKRLADCLDCAAGITH